MTQYIAVMDYRAASIKLYTAETDDVEKWLRENTDYSEDECYYMCSITPILVYSVHSVTFTASMKVPKCLRK